MGYLMANNITINGVDGADNEFLHMLESTKNDAVNNDDNGIAQEDTSYTGTDDGIIKKINVTEEEVNNLPEKEAVMAAQMIIWTIPKMIYILKDTRRSLNRYSQYQILQELTF